MNYYKYDQTSNYYIGTHSAQVSPREPGVFLTPPNSTDVAIPGSYDEETELLLWDGSAWLVETKPVVQDYMAFWISLMGSSYYTRAKSEASTSMARNVAVTEFMILLGDAKDGEPHVSSIQASLDTLLTLVVATTAEQTFLTNLFATTGLNDKYTLNF